MSLVAATSGDNAILNAVLQTNATPETLTLKLYSNNHTPIKADTAGSYTELVGNGYASVVLAKASWGSASAGVSSYPAQTFSFTGTVTVFGYFIVGSTSGTLYWAELVYASGQTFNNGDTFVLTPTITEN